MSSEVLIRVVFVLLHGCIVEDGIARSNGLDYLVSPLHVQGIGPVKGPYEGLACSTLVISGRRHFMVGSMQEIRAKLENAGR